MSDIENASVGNIIVNIIVLLLKAEDFSDLPANPVFCVHSSEPIGTKLSPIHRASM